MWKKDTIKQATCIYRVNDNKCFFPFKSRYSSQTICVFIDILEGVVGQRHYSKDRPRMCESEMCFRFDKSGEASYLCEGYDLITKEFKHRNEKTLCENRSFYMKHQGTGPISTELSWPYVKALRLGLYASWRPTYVIVMDMKDIT
jgi:hypothetical protein